ncbi:MAG TPA: fructosamine kinase family protein [Bacteroidota bacterium]|nr:fructosamine kinase family protein [Bacteroidota bacterium]
MGDLHSHIELVLGRRVLSTEPVGGGSISTTLKVRLQDGGTIFAKVTPQTADMFFREARGLSELARGGAIRTPAVMFCDSEILLLEYIPPTRAANRGRFFEEFGRQFARLHRFCGASFGFEEDNYIGSTPQRNLPRTSSWREFFRVHRLEEQFKLAERNGYADERLSKLFARLENKLPELIPEDRAKPSLLHGDLWQGNYLCAEGSIPVLIDPAVYYGDREADLAMTLLFGGFDESFYEAYNEEWPLGAGWERRMELYKLYHLFNHLNLFGTGYYRQVVDAMAFLCR